MALHQKMLWVSTSRANSSLDITSALGGLIAGCMSFPYYTLQEVKGIRVFNTSNPTVPEDYGNLQSFVTGIGGKAITGGNTGDIAVEFDTTKSTSGSRGIYRVDGLFEREFHYHEALTKGEAMRFMSPHGLDEYTWTGTKKVTGHGTLNLLSLGDFVTDITDGDTTIKNSAMIVLPATVRSRGVLISAIVDGTYVDSGPHDFRIDIRDHTDAVIYRSAPLFTLTNIIKKVTANFLLYTNGTGDKLSTEGFKLSLVNDDDAEITLTGAKIIAQSITNPDFTLG